MKEYGISDSSGTLSRSGVTLNYLVQRNEDGSANISFTIVKKTGLALFASTSTIENAVKDAMGLA